MKNLIRVFMFSVVFALGSWFVFLTKWVPTDKSAVEAFKETWNECLSFFWKEKINE